MSSGWLRGARFRSGGRVLRTYPRMEAHVGILQKVQWSPLATMLVCGAEGSG